MKPVIGVTTSRRSGWRIFPLVAFNIWLAGGKAVRWDTKRPPRLEAVDGVVIGGGDDISPDLYGGTLGISARLDPERDALECELARQALARNLPVLGICRGAQMISVALGGTLDQSAWQTFGMEHKIRTVLPRRAIRIEPDTRLARIAGPEEMTVNALHTQAVRDPGKGVRVAARDMAGMIQAIERLDDPFALGVQWHPEHLFYSRRQRAIFRALVAAAAARDSSLRQVDAALASGERKLV